MKEKGKNRKIFVGVSIILVILLLLLIMFVFSNRYSVKFMVGDKVYYSNKIFGGGYLETPTKNPQKKGYTFVGWYNGNEKYDDDSKINKNVKLEARWEKNVYNVSISDGEGNTSFLDIEYGDKIKEPQTPIRDGYTFVGWYNGNEKYDFDKEVNGDIKLEAKWEKIAYSTYRVQHYLMNRDGKFNSVPDLVETFSGVVGSVVNPQTYSYLGYTSPNVISDKILDNDGLVIKYYYDINKYSLTINGDKNVTNISGSGEYFYGDVVNISYELKPGYSVKSISGNVKDGTVVVTSDMVIGINTVPNSDTKYKIEHYKMDLDGKYSILSDVDDLVGVTDTVTDSKKYIKTYVGFTSPSIVVDKNIEGDNSTVIKYYYDRNKYDLVVKKGTGISKVSGSGKYYYEEEVCVTGEILPGYDGILINGENVNTYKITSSDNQEVVVSSIPQEVSYKIEHYKMDLAGKYTILSDVDDLVGVTDTVTDSKKYIKTYVGFTSPSIVVDKNIEGDNSTVIKYYYDRNKYDLVVKKGIGISKVSGSGKYYYEEEVDVTAILEDGYSFSKWSNDDNNLITTYKIGIGSNEITAFAVPNEYTINFYNLVSDSDIYASVTALYKENITLPDNPTRTGYDFVGWWYLDDDKKFVKEFDSTTMVLNGANLYAKWSLKDESVIFYLSKNDSEPYNYYVGKYGENIVFPENPSKDGYIFDGWYELNSDGSYKDLPFDEEVFFDKNGGIALYAKFTPIDYEIKYNLNGGTNAKENPSSYTVEEEVVLKNPTKPGYKFDGWSPNNKIEKGTTGNKEFTAKFTAIETEYKVNYYVMDEDGNYPEEPDLVIEKGLTDSKVSPHKEIEEGFLLDNQRNTYSETLIDGKGTTSINVYIKRKQYEVNVTTEGNGIDNVKGSGTYYYGKEVTLSATLKEGYKDIKWTNVDTLSEQELTFNVTSDLNIKVTSSLIDYEIKYNLNGGTNAKDNPDSYNVEEEVELKDSTKPGYKFDGWIPNNKIEKGTTGTKEFTAKFTAIETEYKVNYYVMDEDGNYPEEPDLVIEKGLTDSKVSPHKEIEEGFLLDNQRNTYSETLIDGKGTTSIDVYIKRKQYDINVTTEGNGIENVKGSGTYYYGKEVTLSATLKEGYKDIKWTNVDTTREQELTFNVTSDLNIRVTSSLIDYEIKYNLDSDVDNSENPSSYTIEEEVDLKDPKRDGYKFIGWNEYPSGKIPKGTTGEIILTPNWQEYKFIVKYHGVDNTNSVTMDDSEFTYESNDYKLTINKFIKNVNRKLTYKLNYDGSSDYIVDTTGNSRFVGWSLSKDGEVKYTDSMNLINEVKDKIKSSDYVLDLYTVFDDNKVNIVVDYNPTRSKDEQYEYVLDGWLNSSGEKISVGTTYDFGDDTILTANWLKVPDTDSFITTLFNSNSNLQVTDLVSLTSANVDILDVKEDNVKTIVESDLQDNLTNLLSKEEIVSIQINFGEEKYLFGSETNQIIDLNNLYTSLTDTANNPKWRDAGLNPVENSKIPLPSKVDYTNRKLSSLFNKELTVRINLDGTKYKTKDLKDFITYKIKFVNKNGHIITQDRMTAISNVGINEVNSPVKYRFRIKFIGNNIYATYCDDANWNMLEVFVTQGDTGMNAAMQNYFKNNLEVRDIYIYNNVSNSESLEENNDATYISKADSNTIKSTTDLPVFAANIMYAMKLLDRKYSNNFFDILAASGAISSIKNSEIEDKFINVLVNIKDDYVFADDTNNYYIIHTLSPSDFKSRFPDVQFPTN